MEKHVIVVGAGLAGLTCARALHQEGVRVTVFDAADEVGGRVRADIVDGFPLDRGFQVLLTAYPEARRWLDYDALDLQTFYSGALVHTGAGLHRLADPWRHPLAAVASLWGPIGSLADKARVARLRLRLAGIDAEQLFARPEATSAQRLAECGFSPAMTDAFLRPFFSGIFLERELATTSRMLEFTFKMFAEGVAAVPAAGMGAVPRQLADGLPPGTVRLRTAVREATPTFVRLDNGESIDADAVVIATDAWNASPLAGTPTARPGRSVRCHYFRAPSAPVEPRTLVLDGTGGGPANNACVRAGLPGTDGWLVSASVQEPFTASIDEEAEEVRRQLARWFAVDTAEWRRLRSYSIENALPDQSVGALDPTHVAPRLESGLFVCGDYRHTGSIQGAMVSGRTTASAVLAGFQPESLTT